jgi:hypothetical protein
MKKLIFISLVHLLVLSCSKKEQQVKKFTFVSENELVLKEYQLTPPREDDYKMNDVATGPMAKLFQLKNENQKIKDLRASCSTDNCETIELLMRKSEQKIKDYLQQGEFKVSSYVDVIDQSSSYCKFDNYTPDVNDPIKVFNLQFVFPTRTSLNTPGGFELNGNGNGLSSPNARDYANLFVYRSNERLNQNKMNPLMPEVATLPTKLLMRHDSYEIVPIPDQDLGKYYYHSSSPSGWITENDFYLHSKFALSKEHVTVVIVNQNGSKEFFRGNLKNDGGELKTLSNGHYELELHPHFHINTSAYVFEILAHERPSYVVRINGWLGEVLTHKTWEKQPGTNKFKEVPVMPGWTLPGIFNHEMGHNLGLNHTTWAYQVIIDPTNEQNIIGYNCYDMPINSSSAWCGDGIDNNVMDYNCNQDSFSPCQLKVVHWNAMRSTMKEALYKPGCVDPAYNLVIEENLGDVHWDAPHHIIGHVIIKNGSRLHIHCSGTTMARDAQFITEGNAQVFGVENISRRPTDRYCN